MTKCFVPLCSLDATEDGGFCRTHAGMVPDRKEVTLLCYYTTCVEEPNVNIHCYGCPHLIIQVTEPEVSVDCDVKILGPEDTRENIADDLDREIRELFLVKNLNNHDSDVRRERFHHIIKRLRGV